MFWSDSPNLFNLIRVLWLKSCWKFNSLSLISPSNFQSNARRKKRQSAEHFTFESNIHSMLALWKLKKYIAWRTTKRRKRRTGKFSERERRTTCTCDNYQRRRTNTRVLMRVSLFMSVRTGMQSLSRSLFSRALLSSQLGAVYLLVVQYFSGLLLFILPFSTLILVTNGNLAWEFQ